MTKLYMQSILQYSVDTETGAVAVLKKFTTAIKGTQAMSYSKPKKQSKEAEKGVEVSL